MAIKAGGIAATLDLDTGKFSTKLKKAQSQADTFANRLQSGGKKAANAGKKLTAGVTLPIVGIGAAALKVSTDFESGMGEVQALSGATGKDLTKLEGVAREMGSKTKYSASEAAEGLKYMALAGWDTEQMAAGLEPSLLLAGAAGMELGTATDIVTDTMSMFGMEAEEATKMTDMLAYAQANSNTDVEGLGEALKYAGASANAMGYDLADTTALLGTFADQGLKGSAAGTTLNAIFKDMKKASEDGAIGIGETSVAIVDANGNYRDMNDILADAEEATKDMTQAEKDQALGAIFGTQAIKGVNMALEAGTDKIGEFEDGIRSSDGSAKDMYDTMQDNLKGAIEETKSALEEAGIVIGKRLIPMVRDAAEWISKMANKFSNLNPETQDTIIKIAAVAAAIGPLLVIGGTMASGISSMIGLVGTISGGLGTLAGTLAGTAGPATALTGALTTGAAAAAPWIAGIAAAGFAAYKLGQHLSQDALPEVEIFGDEVSESTEQAVGAFLDLEEKATNSLNQIAWSGKELTTDMKESLVADYEEMGQIISEGLEEDYQQSLENHEAYIASSKILTEEEKADILLKTQETYEEKKISVEEGYEQINKILEIATESGTGITELQRKEINRIQSEMQETAVKTLSDGQVESEAILESLRRNSENITARQAADVIKNSVEQKKKTIKNAEDQAADTIENIIRQRDETGTLSEEQATKLIDEAIRQRDDTVAMAEDQHQKVVTEASEQAGEQIGLIDTSTGEMKSKWEVFKENIVEKTQQMGKDTKAELSDLKERGIQSVEDLVNGWIEWMEDWMTRGVEKAEDIADGIIEGLRSMIKKAKEVGGDVIDGLSEGLENAKSAVVKKAKNIGNAISRGFQNVLQIFSPSRVFVRHGENISLGAAKGIENKKKAAVREAEKMGREIITQFDRLEDAVITALKRRYREEERIERKAIEKKIKGNRRAADEILGIWEKQYAERLNLVDKEMTEEEKALQDKIDALNAKTKAEEDALKEEQYQKDLAEKKKQIAQETDNKKLVKLKEELNEMIAQREREHLLERRQEKIEDLRDEMEKVREQGQKKKEALEKEHQEKVKALELRMQTIMNNYDKEMEETQLHYERLLESERLQAEARTIILDGNNQELIELLESYNPHWDDAGQSFGESLLEGLHSMKASIKAEVEDILSMVNAADRASANIAHQNDAIRRAQRDWQSADRRGDSDAKDRAHQRAEEARRKGGTIQNRAHGTNYFSGGYTWVGEQGRELIKLPKGTEINSNDKSERMMSSGRSIHQEINIYSPTALSPSEVKRKQLQASRELALEWGM